MGVEMSYAEKSFALDTGSFPFESHFADIGKARLHYIDEGEGPLLFFLHGNPSWSYVYRNIIAALKHDHRCIAVDLAGFGLSTPPPDFDYTPAEQSTLIAGFLADLNIQDATLIAHDWGGPIGLSAMMQTDGCITRLCLGNTWAWQVNGDFHFEWFSKLMGGAIGRFGTNRFAMFINAVMPAAMKRRKLTDDEMRAYRAPFKNGRPRTPMHILPKHITASGAWLSALEQQLQAFDGPVKLIWPDSDIAFRMKELERWGNVLPQADITVLENCGHYIWEDAPDESIDLIRQSVAVQARGAV